MKVILKKLIKDFWLTKGKLALCLIAACLSAWGISTVIYSYALAERDFEVNFTKTFPADFEILVDNYTAGLDRLFLDDANVVDVERREIVGASAESKDGHNRRVRIFATDNIDNLRLDVFQILEEKPGGKGKLFIETNAAFFLDSEQDSLELAFMGDKKVTWPISGITHDARLAPAQMERTIYAYVSSIEMIAPYLKPGRRRFLIETDQSSDRQAIQEVADRLSQLTEQQGAQVVYVNIPVPGEHMHQNIVDGISFLQKSSGGVISIMGVVLLSLMLLTWIFPQLMEVGIMKALGASTQRIFYSYCLVLLIILSIGMAIGMPLGYLTAAGFNRIVALVQNFQPVKEILPFPVHLIVVLTALSIPLIVGSLPLLRAARTTVYEAMNKTFHTSAMGVFKASQNFISNSALQYNLNNLFRNSTRTALTLILTAVGVGLYFSGVNLQYSIRQEMDNFAEEANYGLRMSFSKDFKPEDVDFLSDLPFVEQISSMKDISVSYRPPKAAFRESRAMRILSNKHQLDEGFVLLGEIQSGCTDCLYVSGEAMEDEFRDTKLGDRIVLTMPSGLEREFVYSGIFKDMAAIGSPFFVFDDEATREFNALAFQIRDGMPNYEASNLIDDALLENGIDVAGSMNVDLRLASLEGHLEPTYLIIKMTGIFTILIGFLSLLIVLNLTIQERTREIGVVKSLGGSFRQVSGIFQKEFLMVNLLAILVGIITAIPLNVALCKVLGETVIYHEIPAQGNITVIIFTSALIVLVQTVLIAIYNKIKLNKNARELLDYNF